MTDTLQFAEYLLIAALVFILISLICNIVVLTSRSRAQRKVVESQRVLVTAGAPGSDVDDGSTVTAVAAAESDTQAAPRRRGGLANFATAFAVVAFLLLTAYLAIRISVTGHGPFSNQHEFAVSFVWGIMLAYLVVELRYHIRMLSVIVLPVAACLLYYGARQPNEIEPLVPALQNSTFLTLHVSFAVVSYGAACVSFGAAVIYLLYPKLHFRSMPRREVLDDIGYKAAVVTFPLMTIMIALGAVWANTAWGRPWGWDPKETAALVTWLIYAAYLHARVVRGWRGKKSAILLVVGFAAVLFAYFGNHFFGGLHSYG